LLDAIANGAIPRTDLHAYNVRQLVEFKDEALTQRIGEVWGEIRGASADSQKLIQQYKDLLTPEFLASADPANGRRVFDATCSSCHVLFGEGGTVGPDITGSNRANLDYILENVVEPSAVLGKDYRMTILETIDGRVISGLITRETESAVTLRTINEAEVLVATDDIEARRLSDLSVMPERQLDQMSKEEVRDLIAYLGSPHQVAPRGPRAPIDAESGRVPHAIEGETMNVVDKSDGSAKNQDMKPFAKDRWSGDDHLWWTGGKPGSKLALEFTAPQDGAYDVELVLTRASDYGIFQLAIDGVPLGGALDLYNAPDVITTGVLTYPNRRLDAGPHRLEVTIVDKNPQAVAAYMFGLDYLRLVPAESK
jgi:putative heme-binding domain-containing protein